MSVNIVLKTILDDKGIKNAEKSFARLGSSVMKVGKVLLAGAGFASITKGLTQAARAAAEDAKSQALLARQLENTVGANANLIASVEKSINAMSMSAAIADDTLRPAFSQLVRVTGDTEQATRLMQIALDVSAGTGRDLQAVTIALSKAYQGNTSALSRLGIKAQDGVDVFAQLEEQFAGAAETAARNDPFQRIAVTVGELQEKIGVELLPQLNDFADYLAESEFQTAFTDLATAIGLVIDQIDIMSKQITGDSALTVLLNMATTVGYGIAELAFIVGDAANTLGKFFSGDWAGAANNVSTFITRYNKFIDQLKDEVLASRKIIETPLKPGGVAKSTITGIATGSSGAKEAQSQFDKVRKIIKDYQGKLLKAEQDYNKAKLEINQEYEDTVKKLREDAAQAQLDIVNESIDRLRNAFRSATQFGLGDLFGTQTINEVTTQVKKLTDRLTVTVAKETSRTIGGTVDDLISSLGEKLAASRSLVKNATDLAAKGFSQTFIEQVVETGTDTGNVLASAILNASPEQQAALKKNFLELETVSETGMDALAKKIYDSQGLATRELKALYTTVQKELDAALLAEQAALAKALADAGYAFTESIAGIKTEFEDVIDSLDGKFAGLGKTIDKLLAKMAQLQGKGITDVQAALISDGGPLKDNTITQDIKVAKNAFDAVGIVIDSAADIEGSMAYIQARIDAANRYIKNVGANTAQGASATASVGKFTQELANLQAAAATGNAAGTIVNINVKTDTTQSAAMVGNTIGKVITKYQSTGGTVRVSGQQ